VCLVPAQHWHRRGLFDDNRALWGGYVVRGTRAVYHSGDTGYFDGFHAIGRAFPSIDVALLPLGAYEPRWFMSTQHMAPEQSAQAFLDLGAAQFVGMHWGTFDLSDESVDDGPRLLARVVEEDARVDPRRFHVLRHGGSLGLDGRDAPLVSG
jgi:L-ascorbate metabolism protein UlaG (beta-lactamase superfamily)